LFDAGCNVDKGFIYRYGLEIIGMRHQDGVELERELFVAGKILWSMWETGETNRDVHSQLELVRDGHDGRT
jgi:hypothetical protein